MKKNKNLKGLFIRPDFNHIFNISGMHRFLNFKRSRRSYEMIFWRCMFDKGKNFRPWMSTESPTRMYEAGFDIGITCVSSLKNLYIPKNWPIFRWFVSYFQIRTLYDSVCLFVEWRQILKWGFPRKKCLNFHLH